MNRRLTARRRLARFSACVLLASALGAWTAPVLAQDAGTLLIRNATVHTAGAQGTLHDTDVLVQGGTIRAIGKALTAPAGAQVKKNRPGRPGRAWLA